MLLPQNLRSAEFFDKLCIINSYVAASEFTILHISWPNLHHTFKTVELLRNSFNCFTTIAAEKIIHFFATMVSIHNDSIGTSYMSVAAILSAILEKEADKVALGVSECMCKKELGQNTYLELCNSRNRSVFR